MSGIPITWHVARAQPSFVIRSSKYASGPSVCNTLRRIVSNGSLHIEHRTDARARGRVKNMTTDLLDEVLKLKGLGSDYALAKLLNVRTQTISSYRTGRTQMSDEMALRAARVLGRAPAPVFAQLAAERAKHPEVAKVWTDAARVLGRRSTKAE